MSIEPFYTQPIAGEPVRFFATSTANKIDGPPWVALEDLALAFNLPAHAPSNICAGLRAISGPGALHTTLVCDGETLTAIAPHIAIQLMQVAWTEKDISHEVGLQFMDAIGKALANLSSRSGAEDPKAYFMRALDCIMAPLEDE